MGGRIHVAFDVAADADADDKRLFIINAPLYRAIPVQHVLF
jgi:hypothetical protein